MKFLIIGSNGMLGSEFMRQLGSGATGWDKDRIDITNLAEMDKICALRPDVIINCAAYNAVDKAEEEKDKADAVNGHAAGYLAKTAREIGAILVHFSTDFVFDGESEAGYKEDSMPKPLSVYGRSKLLGEELVQKEADKFYIIRLSGLFGRPGIGDGAKVSFPEFIANNMKQGKNLTIVSDEFTSPTYAPDLVKTVIRSIKDSAPFGIYHGVNSGFLSWYDYAKKIMEIMKLTGKIDPISRVDLERPAERPRRALLLNTKLVQARNYEDALREYIYGSLDNNG